MKSNKKKIIILPIILFLIGILAGGIISIVFNINIQNSRKETKNLIQEKELLQEKIKLIKISLFNMEKVPIISNNERIGVITEIKDNKLIIEAYFPEEGDDSVLADAWWLVENTTISVKESTRILAYDFTKNISLELDDVEKVQFKDFSSFNIGDYIYVMAENLERDETNIIADEIRVMMFSDDIQRY